MSSRTFQACVLVGVVGSVFLGACAALSGLDALEICQGSACDDGGVIADGTVGGDDQAASDGGGNQRGNDGSGNDGGGGDGSDGSAGNDGAGGDTGTDAAKPDAGQDSGGVTLPCGNGGGLVCTGGQVCCLGAAPSCAASCATGITITCERPQDCTAPNPVCCGMNLGQGDAGSSACVHDKGQCPDPQSLVFCDPNGPPCGNGDSCTGIKIIGGQTFHFCD
jgi:hypothetical protein